MDPCMPSSYNKQGIFPNKHQGLCPLDKLDQLPSQEQDKNQAGFKFLSSESCEDMVKGAAE